MRRIGVWDFLFYLVIVAIVYALVRPGSKAGVAIVAVTDALAATIGVVTGSTLRGG